MSERKDISGVLGVIIARAGSTGLPGKNKRILLGKPVISYTIESALNSKLLDAIIVTSDDADVREIASGYEDVWVTGRPAELATDTAPVDAAARFGCERAEELYGFHADIIVLLYGNIPIRPEGLIDLAVNELITKGGDSVQSYSPVGKFHPDWMVMLEEGGYVKLNCPNHPYRRQELRPMFIPNGAVLAIRRESLYRKPEHERDFHAFLGKDRRGIVHPESDLIVDIDTLKDLYIAEGILRMLKEQKVDVSGKAQAVLV